MAQVETVTADDIPAMDLDELKRTNAEIDVDASELSFPSMAHHMTVRGKLEALVDKGAISYDEMENIYARWKENKQ